MPSSNSSSTAPAPAPATLSREASLNSSGSDNDSGPAAFGSLSGNYNRMNPDASASASTSTTGDGGGSSGGRKRVPSSPPLPTASRAPSTTAVGPPSLDSGPGDGSGAVVSHSTCTAGAPRALPLLDVEGVLVEERIRGADRRSPERGARVPVARVVPPPPATPLSEAIATKRLADIDGVGRSAGVWGNNDDWTKSTAGDGGGGGGGGDDEARRRHWLSTAASRRGDGRFTSSNAKESGEESEASSNEGQSSSRTPSPKAADGGGYSAGGGGVSISGMGMAVAGRGLGHAGQAAAGGGAATGRGAAAGSRLAQVGGGRTMLASPITRPSDSSSAAAAAAAAALAVGTAVGTATGFSNTAVPVLPSYNSGDGDGGDRSNHRSEGNEPGRVICSKEGAARADDMSSFARNHVGTLSSDEGSTATGGTTESSDRSLDRSFDVDHGLLSGGDLCGVGWRDTPSYGEALYMGTSDETQSGRRWGGRDKYDADRELEERRRVVQEVGGLIFFFLFESAVGVRFFLFCGKLKLSTPVLN